MLNGEITNEDQVMKDLFMGIKSGQLNPKGTPLESWYNLLNKSWKKYVGNWGEVEARAVQSRAREAVRTGSTDVYKTHPFSKLDVAPEDIYMSSPTSSNPVTYEDLFAPIFKDTTK